MKHVNDQLLQILEALEEDDFKHFKIYLRDCAKELNLKQIPVRHLKSKEPVETAVLMGKYYPDRLLEVTEFVLRKIPRMDLVETLQNNSPNPEVPEEDPNPSNIITYQRRLQSFLTDRFKAVKQGMAETHNNECLEDFFVELFITDGGDIEINDQHEIDWSARPKAKAAVAETPINPNDIFQTANDKPIRTVLTAGIAGIGKTILVKKFVLDWANGRQNQDIHFLFPFSFSELNMLKEKQMTLAELVYESCWETKDIPKKYLQKVFTELQESGCRDYKNENNKYKILFVLDGLDESRLKLDLPKSGKPFNVTESASVEVLLLALIRGELLPSARLWICTRPGAVKQIDDGLVQRKTLVRGFNDPQKEEYFRKKFPANQARTIIAHIKASRSLFIMCHIPVFCWITTIVLKEVLQRKANMELPATLTEMYSEFLMYEITSTGEKCGKKKSIRYIKSLAKLAFVKLNEGNLFYKKDLKESGIKSHKALLYVDVLTEVFTEVHRWREDSAHKEYSFVHLSLMEYLAALHVVMSLINENRNVMSSKKLDLGRCFMPCEKKSLTEVHTLAIQDALQSSNGHRDLFLRFLLGLSLQSSLDSLKPLLKASKKQTQNNFQDTVEFIQTRIRENTSTERTFNLFYCLNELKEYSLVNEIQKYLNTENLSPGRLTPLNWQALVFFLVSSEKTVNEFDLSKYCPTEEGLLRLLPVVKASKRSLLMSCRLTQTGCHALADVLCSENSILMELDLSDNELKDAGAKRLSLGLQKRTCTLQILRLSGCMIAAEGCKDLVSALKANPSHLKELDLSFNHPGDSMKMLKDLKKETNPQLNLNLRNCGASRLTVGHKKYWCKLVLDPNTAHRNMKLSNHDMVVTSVEEKLPYPHHQDRFDSWLQVLGDAELDGRCYWEVSWCGSAHIGVTYKGIIRKGEGADIGLGSNDHSWALLCQGEDSYSVQHENEVTAIQSASSSTTRRVAVFLDFQAGILSFFKVDVHRLIELHRFTSKFTEPLYPAFGFGVDYSSIKFGSSVSLT